MVKKILRVLGLISGIMVPGTLQFFGAGLTLS